MYLTNAIAKLCVSVACIFMCHEINLRLRQFKFLKWHSKYVNNSTKTPKATATHCRCESVKKKKKKELCISLRASGIYDSVCVVARRHIVPVQAYWSVDFMFSYFLCVFVKSFNFYKKGKSWLSWVGETPQLVMWHWQRATRTQLIHIHIHTHFFCMAHSRPIGSMLLSEQGAGGEEEQQGKLLIKGSC